MIEFQCGDVPWHIHFQSLYQLLPLTLHGASEANQWINIAEYLFLRFYSRSSEKMTELLFCILKKINFTHFFTIYAILYNMAT